MKGGRICNDEMEPYAKMQWGVCNTPLLASIWGPIRRSTCGPMSFPCGSTTLVIGKV
jgi:hypothetical protein